ncbi:hypothetical protein LSCM1_06313 [Leishmania martiniquensis]|uniref:Uncharacterized protein n=1 Tax=Leishmania martiniquensis TaxID=1580590 RepID=A0A836GWV3_9TRYP|nr:hypothetical protein LSCM1_06313 [Leishmania martiniquensis]
MSRPRPVSLACVLVAIVAPLICVQAVLVQGSDIATAQAQERAPESEKHTHVLRLALIILPVMFGVWLILCSIFALIFIRVCPNLYTK